MKLFDAASMREVDRRMIEELGLPGAVLMESAGRGAAVFAMAVMPGLREQGVSIICGKGNNGGDGFVMGRYFQSWGIDTEVVRVFPPESTMGDAALHMRVAQRSGVRFLDCHNHDDITRYFGELPSKRIVVDALLGTGVKGSVRGHIASVLKEMTKSGCPVFAVDIPSGIQADDGLNLGWANHALATATFAGLKLGLVIGDGAAFAGQVRVIDLGFSPSHLSALSCGEALDEAFVAKVLPKRPTWGHKGTFGHVLVVAGSPGKFGAAAMTALSAMRSGAGLVTLATPKTAVVGPIHLPMEVMVEPFECDAAGAYTQGAIQKILALCEGKDAIAIGPGLGLGAGLKSLVKAVVNTGIPSVIDADALNALGDLTGAEPLGNHVILTPHPGEMARLLNLTVPDIQGARLKATRSLATSTEATILLKGEGTLIVGPSGKLRVNTTGNNGMGTAGAGDVLTGLLVGFLAQGLNPEDGASAGAFVHGLAGDLMVKTKGERTLIATDIIDGFAGAFAHISGHKK